MEDTLLECTATERRLAQAERVAHVGFWECDLRTGALTWTAEAASLVGLPPAGATAMTPDALLAHCHPEDRDRVAAQVREAVRTGAAFHAELRVVLPGGRLGWRAVEGESFRLPAARCVTGIVRDVTEHKRREVWLVAERDILERIARGAPLGETLAAVARLIEDRAQGMLASILLVDDSGHVRVGAAPSLPDTYNLAIDGAAIGPAAGSCGTAAWRGEIVSTPDIATDPLWRDYAAVALAHGLVSSWSTPLFGAENRVIGTLALYYLSRQDPRPQDLRAVGIARHLAEIAIERHRGDVALRAYGEELEQRVAERTQALARANEGLAAEIEARTRVEAELEARVLRRTQELEAANQELRSFAYTVSHDLRGPVRTIKAFSEVILRDHAEGLDETGRANLRRVVAAGGRMSQLIDDILQLSRITSGELVYGPVDISAIAREVVDALRTASPTRDVQVDIPPGLVDRGDPRLLRVLLENLLGNAWKYTSQHSRAHIELGVTNLEGQRVYFLRDDGAGFEMSGAGHLFEPFTRLHADADFEGTGVGLATCQRIVRRHGGTIWAEAAVERGATFYFTLGGPAGAAAPG